MQEKIYPFIFLTAPRTIRFDHIGIALKFQIYFKYDVIFHINPLSCRLRSMVEVL